jgi:hypothetical protein
MRIREYISYSQMITVEDNSELYVKKYIYGERTPINRGQDLGKIVAEALETGEPTGDPTIDLVLPLVPNYSVRDKEIMVNMGEIPIMLKMDGVRADFKGIIEHKTGPKGTWCQKKADKWDQITFYCTGIYIKTGKIPKAKLVHIITDRDEEGNYYLTGEVKTYDTERSYKDVLIMMGRIKRAWKKIEKIINEELL